jgi:chemosensory pili system protein ChpA (sensor histidine kinase/response regulator)
MVPLASMATRLQRAVRVTARQRGKEVDIYLEGEEVPFDKSMLEEMNEALLHLLRNAVDHGIEAPEVRRNSNKPQQGTIHLRAFREGTQIVIQISDDGAGLDPQRLRAKAIQNGILSEEEAEQRRDDQLYPLIFAPGFSTASEVSEVSGRGVGMDIVHTTVSRLKGRITVDSTLGEGTTFMVRLPLTLALARVLLVKAHGQIFALPLADVIQVVNLDPKAIEYLGDTQVIRLDGSVLPIVPLGEKLGLPNLSDQTENRVPVVVAQASDKYVVFVVDELLGGREVVVKTLGTHLRHVHGITGSTLMGDGSIVLILNVSELVHEKKRRPSRKSANRLTQASRANEAFEILVVDDSFSVRRVVANLVKSAGWQPILAKNGLEALDIVQRARRLPDLILLDVEMPQMDGYELTSTLRAQDAYQQLPIVMLTSRAGEKHRRKAFEVGATEYLVKPYQDVTLVELVRRLVVQARGTSAV